MGPRDFLIEMDEDGSRLETFLRKKLGLARNVALKALRKGWVRVDGRRARANRRLVKGEVVRITNYALPLPALEQEPRPRPTVPPDVLQRARSSLLFEDADLVVSTKPAGQVVHAGTNHPYGWIDALGTHLDASLTPIGRLDRDTSGLLALARSRLAARHLFAALREGTLNRRYTALVLGRLQAEEGRIEAQVEGRTAVSRYRVLERFGEATLVEVELETGRTHQIRIHFQGLGHPLLGDPRYGDPQDSNERFGVERLFLHAGRLEVPHPTTHELLVFEDPLPPHLKAVISSLR